MNTKFTFGKLFFGIVILLFGGFLWTALKPSDNAGTALDRASQAAKGTVGKIGDSAAEIKEKTAAMVDTASKKAGDMAGKVSDKAGDMAGKAADTAAGAYNTAGNMAEQAMDKTGDMAGKVVAKAGDAYNAAGDMAEKTMDKTGDMAGKVADKAVGAYKASELSGESSQSAGDRVVQAGEANMSAVGTSTSDSSDYANKAMASAKGTMRSDDMQKMAGEQTEGRIVEVPAKYQPKGAGDISRPALTDAGTWRYEAVQFDHDQWDLRTSAFPSLKTLAALMNAEPDLNIEIHGHTDNNGSRTYNMDLSQRRAASVKSYLESQGIASSRMTVKGYGPDRPLSGNMSDDGFSGNRRVEIKPLN